MASAVLWKRCLTDAELATAAGNIRAAMALRGIAA
jgi:hypothetical protein